MSKRQLPIPLPKGTRKDLLQLGKNKAKHEEFNYFKALEHKFTLSPKLNVEYSCTVPIISLLLFASIVGANSNIQSQEKVTNSGSGGTDQESSSRTFPLIESNYTTSVNITTNSTLPSFNAINPGISSSTAQAPSSFLPSSKGSSIPCSVDKLSKVANQEKTEPFMGKFGLYFPHPGTLTLGDGKNNYEITPENIDELTFNLLYEGKITPDMSDDESFSIIQQALSEIYRSFSIDSIPHSSDPKDRERLEKTCDYVNQAVIAKSSFPNNEDEWINLSNKINSYLRGNSNNSNNSYRNQDVIIKKVSSLIPNFSNSKGMKKYLREHGTKEDLSNYNALLKIMKSTGIKNPASNENNIVFKLLSSNKESKAKEFVKKHYVINTLTKEKIENKVVTLFKKLTQDLKQIEKVTADAKANKEAIIDKYIEIAATVHNEFVKIHPFEDGNGRTARLLVNIILKKSGLIPFFVAITNEDYTNAVNADIEEGSTKYLTKYLSKTICQLTKLKSHPDFSANLAEKIIAACDDGNCGKLFHDTIEKMINDPEEISADQTPVLNGEVGIY